MKSTGIVRKIDMLGRIVLPIELRRHLHIETDDDIEIFVEGNSIVLKKFCPLCIFCGSKKDLVEYAGKNVCAKCRRTLETK